MKPRSYSRESRDMAIVIGAVMLTVLNTFCILMILRILLDLIRSIAGMS